MKTGDSPGAAPVLLLRTVNADRRGRAGFVWPESGRVSMRPGGWFGGFVWGQGTARQLEELCPDDPGMVWQLVAVNPTDVQGHAACRGEVVYSGHRAGAIALLARQAPPGTLLPWRDVAVGDGGTAVTGPFGTARVGCDGWAIAGEKGHAIAGACSAAAADHGGRITLTAPDGLATRTFLAGGLFAEARRLYWLGEDGLLHEGPRVVLDEHGWFRMEGDQVERLP